MNVLGNPCFLEYFILRVVYSIYRYFTWLQVYQLRWDRAVLCMVLMITTSHPIFVSGVSQWAIPAAFVYCTFSHWNLCFHSLTNACQPYFLAFFSFAFYIFPIIFLGKRNTIVTCFKKFHSKDYLRPFSWNWLMDQSEASWNIYFFYPMVYYLWKFSTIFHRN